MAKSRKAVVMKLLKEKCKKREQLAKVNGEKDIGGSSTATHMASFPTTDTKPRGTGVLGMTRSLDMAVWTLVLGEIGAYMVRRLALIVLGDEGKRDGVRCNNRLSPSSRFHNHLQSPREDNVT